MDQGNTPAREIGLPGAVLINLNAVVGAGMFALPALLYAGAGGFAPLVIIGFAFFVALDLLVWAKLSTQFDHSGGPQLYAEHAFGPFAGFQTGWFILAQNIAARAANFHVLVSYLAAIFPFFDHPAIRLATIFALIALFTGLAAVGTRRSIEALWIGTALKLGPILLICLVGLIANGLPSGFVMPEFTGAEAIALLLAYAFSGGAVSTIVAGEVKEAKRTVYRSIFVKLSLIALLYAFVQLAYVAIDPQDVNADRPLASAAQAVFGQWGVIAISVAAIFSTGTNQLSYFVSMPRIFFAMSEQGLLPAFLSRVSGRFGTPANAIMLYGAIVILLALSGTFASLATFMVALESLAGLLVVLALPRMWQRGELVLGWLWVPVVLAALAFNGWLLIQVPANAALPTLAVLAVGSLLYAVARQRKPKDGGDGA